MSPEHKSRELKRLGDTFTALAERANNPHRMPGIGADVTYLRTGRERRHTGRVQEIAPPPVLAVRVEPAHEGWKQIWVTIEEINAARKE